MIKAVIFDYGGVVSASEIQHVEQDLVDHISKFLQLDVSQHAGEILDVADRFQRGQLDEKGFWQALADKFKLQLPDFGKFEWGEPESMKPQPQVVELAHELQRQGIKAAILSNAYPTVAVLVRQVGGYEA